MKSNSTNKRIVEFPISKEITDLLDFIDLKIDSEYVVETLQDVIKLTSELSNEVGSFLFTEISHEFEYLADKYTHGRSEPLDENDTHRLKLKASFWLSELEHDKVLTHNKPNILPNTKKWHNEEDSTNKF